MADEKMNCEEDSTENSAFAFKIDNRMADEKMYCEEDSTENSVFAKQTDEDVGFLSMQNEMAGPVGIVDDHTHDRSSSNPGFTAGFSGFANNADGISNLAHNVDGSSSFSRNVGVNSNMVKNASEFFGPAQNMHGWTSNSFNVHFVPGFGGNMGAGFQIVDSNTGFPAAGPRFQAYQNSPVQTVEDGLFPERRGLQMPGQIMPVARGTGPPQTSNVPIGPSHMRYITQFPPIVHPIQCINISKKPSTHQSTSESTQAAPSFTPVPEIFPVPLQANTAASLTHLPRTAAFLQPAYQSTTLPSLAQTARPPSPLDKKIPSQMKGKSKINDRARNPGQVKSAARGSGLAQASKSSVGSSLKRGATEPPSIARPGQRRATNHSSVSASAQTASPPAHRSQNAPFPPHALTAASFTAFPRTADYRRTLSQNRALPYPLQTVHPYSQIAREIPHIRRSQDSSRLPQPIGYICCLCNMDLSFTPEGLILQPGIHPNAAVLPCGHHYHDHCLQQITPADQTENPSCIECQKLEIEEVKNEMK